MVSNGILVGCPWYLWTDIHVLWNTRLLPFKSVELNLEIEFDGNLICQDADKCKWLSLGVTIVYSADNL